MKDLHTALAREHTNAVCNSIELLMYMYTYKVIPCARVFCPVIIFWKLHTPL